uniref:Putative ovule protein n=1 Tax=Solanum chacoense TaxID=4108 RepID=A0A0V0H5A1_SOLCH
MFFSFLLRPFVSLFSCYYAHKFHISKIVLFTCHAAPVSDSPKYTTQGELDPLTFLENLNSIESGHLFHIQRKFPSFNYP